MTIEEAKLTIQNSITMGSNIVLNITNALLGLDYDNLNPDDKQDVERLFRAVKNIHFMLTHINDTYKLLGTNRNVERYFNVENGKIVEVDREHYNGDPDAID